MEQKSAAPMSSQSGVTRIIPIMMEGDVPSKRDTNSKSIPDQQPAAPKVVLPVLEPSASSTNVAKPAQEAEKVAEERDGRYFMKVKCVRGDAHRVTHDRSSLLGNSWTCCCIFRC